jgi:hypothetical protein
LNSSYDVAHLNIRDVRVVVVFLAQRPDADFYGALQSSAKLAGLMGDVVAVWPDEFGRTRFLGLPERHAFFEVAGYDQLRAQINATLHCSP